MNEFVEKIALDLGVNVNFVWIGIGAIGVLLLQLLFKRRSDNRVSNRFTAPTSTTIKFGSSTFSSMSSDSPSPETFSSSSITVNGKEIPIESEIAMKITDAVKSGNLIQAIKELRNVSSLSLVDSKQVVEVLKKELEQLKK